MTLSPSKYISLVFGGLILSASMMYASYDTNPPFNLPSKFVITKGKEKVYNPKNSYNIFINYELGMHCVGFDIAYCCVIPPYNSVQAQAVKSGSYGKLPTLLSPQDNVKLHYSTKDNTYSEGNKMRYWGISKDVDGNGRMDDPGDNIANYVWKHLFIYKDLEGTIPAGSTDANRLHVGGEINVPIDAGPSGKPMSGGYMDYADNTGTNVVFVDTLVPEVKNVGLVLTTSNVWDALGLPLTAFYDSERTGSIRTITNKDFHPFQKSVVQLQDHKGQAIKDKKTGKAVEYFGTNPVDIPNCYTCHSRNGQAAKMARDEGIKTSDIEYNYWKNNYPDMSEYMARLSEGSINILGLHDKHHGTKFLSTYRKDASSQRLGKTGPVNCADCHGDNISGNLKEPRVGVTGYTAVKAKPLTEAIHGFHMALVPMPDAAGRSQACQACHPTHWQDARQNDPNSPNAFIDPDGNARFSNTDVRIASGGCFLGRDAHTNPNAKPPFFLNEIGKHYYNTVSTTDENRKPTGKIRGLYCTNCHNQLAHELYKADMISDPAQQLGDTLRNKTLKDIVQAVANGDMDNFKTNFTDPTSKGDNPLAKFYAEHKGATLVKATKPDGKLTLGAWFQKEGGAVPYEGASAGSDWWLAAAEPHCADCHIAPFVESEGGKYFPIDQPKKYSLYRYSKAHGTIACQSCHESIHGLYSSTYKGESSSVDPTTHQQALQYSPDGKYDGPVTCAACHTVNKKGVPTQLKGTEYYNDYWGAVTLMHNMREGDQKMSVKDLVKKFPYSKAQEIIKKGWN